MYKRLMFAAVFAMMLAACTGHKETHLSAQFDDNAPESLKVTVHGMIDTTVYVKGGKCEVDVPVNVTSISRIHAGKAVYTFISDGSRITLVPAEGKAYSDQKNGVHSRFVEYNKWLEEFLATYHQKVGEMGDDKEAADAYFKEMQEKYNDYQRATIKANKDNVLASVALSHLNSDDPKEILSLINSLSPEIQALPDVAGLKKEFASKDK
ncbi:MAG: hypothetical protein IJ611_01365 [Bacteroidales bacterium]|nr:hypothetical protein [Bacteroidales bacterium]